MGNGSGVSRGDRNRNAWRQFRVAAAVHWSAAPRSGGGSSGSDSVSAVVTALAYHAWLVMELWRIWTAIGYSGRAR
jgi:hypothetical protein